MSALGIQHLAGQVKRLGMRQQALVATGHGTGVLLTTRPDSPGVLGMGVVDRSRDSATLGLSVSEATALRDALSAWLEKVAG